MLTPLKRRQPEFSRDFRVFEYLLWRKMKTQECRKSTESFLNQKKPIVNCKTPILISNEILGIGFSL